ncbi:hypothetical protein [Treponema endosymbiont of Eucomonympha sp.]|uniref:hypothetical protein n=1 Tax=Treponema endosymbiont of Eucomonympha sp. TaxID=1580831 RepID=UPI0007508061|nr:hypothetical protein [Treponema endosymbiont of Eucomonympha sp.]
MNKTKNALLGIVSALALAGAGFALYSCDGFADAAAQAADAGRYVEELAPRYSIRGPRGWVDYEFEKDNMVTPLKNSAWGDEAKRIDDLEKDYVLGTDRTVHVEHYWRYTNDRLRKKLEAQGITVTDYYSTSKAGEYCYVEFNLKEITAIKRV